MGRRMFTGEVLELEVPRSGYCRRYEHVIHCSRCRDGIREDDLVDGHRHSGVGLPSPYRAVALYEVLWFQRTVGLTLHHEMQLHWKEYG